MHKPGQTGSPSASPWRSLGCPSPEHHRLASILHHYSFHPAHLPERPVEVSQNPNGGEGPDSIKFDTLSSSRWGTRHMSLEQPGANPFCKNLADLLHAAGDCKFVPCSTRVV
eukprot:11330934-Prorocentrum_lima.AAC.1